MSQRPFKNSPIWSHWTGTYTAILILSYHKSRKITATFWGKKWVFTWKLELHAVWPDLAKFRHFCNILKVFGQFLKLLFGIWQNFEHNWANYMFWANLHCYKRPNIEKISKLLVTLILMQSFQSKIFLQRSKDKWSN